jgi:hypothetical protein
MRRKLRPEENGTIMEDKRFMRIGKDIPGFSGGLRQKL